jgi:hypothetical protein
MRKAGLAVLEAAHTRNQEKVSDATNDLADACSNCHEVYRDKGTRGQSRALQRSPEEMSHTEGPEETPVGFVPFFDGVVIAQS